MAKHGYNSQQALDEILKGVRAQAPELAAEIERNIDLGQAVEETSSPRQRGNEPDHERKVAFTPEEAIQVALDTLQAYFVEQPSFLISAQRNFARAAEGTPVLQTGVVPDPAATMMHGTEMLSLTGAGAPKALAFEVQPETRLVAAGEPILPVKPITEEQLAARRERLDALRKLTDFNE